MRSPYSYIRAMLRSFGNWKAWGIAAGVVGGYTYYEVYMSQSITPETFSDAERDAWNEATKKANPFVSK